MKKVLLSASVSCIFILFLLQQPATEGVSPALTPTRDGRTLGMQLPRKLNALADKEKHKMKELKIKVSSTSFERKDDEEKSLINTADYQVVTTHVSPSPKHPYP